MDEDGFVFVKDTTKRFIRMNCINISLTELETLLSAAYPQSKHAIVVIADSRARKQIVLFTTASNITCSELKKVFEDKMLAELTVPCRVETLADIPIVGTGKTDYNKLIEIAKGIFK